MTDYYVSLTGNDGAAGTSVAPKRTIAAAWALASAGSKIYIGPGVWSEVVTLAGKSGSDGSPITFTKWPGQSKPRFYGAGPAAYFVINSGTYLVIDGLQFGGTSKNDAVSMGGVAVAPTGTCSHITVRNCEFGFLVLRHSFLAANNSANDMTYLTVEDNYCHDTVGNASSYNETITVAGNADYVLIQRNELRNVSFIGIDAIGQDSSGYYYQGRQPNHVIIRENVIDGVLVASGGSPGVGIKLDGMGQYALIEDNTVTNASGLVTGAEPTGDIPNGLPDKQKYIIVRNNRFDCRNTHASNYGAGWGMGSNGMTDPIDSPASNPNHQFKSKVTYSALVHNILAGTNYGIGLWRAEHTGVKNNIVGATSGRMTQTDDLNRDATLSPSTNVFDGNLYWPLAGPFWQWFDVPGTSHETLAAYQSASTEEANSLVGSPTFADGGYTLMPDSAGYGQGVALTTATNSGSGATALTVADIFYFCDGWTLRGGDQIRIGSNTHQISSINYGTSTITLAEPATWTSGDEIHYAYEGDDNAPSMGLTATVSDGAQQRPDDNDESITRHVAIVATGSDDCFIRNGGDDFSTSAGLFAGDYLGDAVDYEMGLRFELPIDVDDDATLAAAYVQLVASWADGANWSLAIRGELSATPATFSTSGNYTGRTRTTTSVSWTPAAWAANVAYLTADVAPILRELAAAYGGLSAGDYVVLFIGDADDGGGTRRLLGAYSYEDDATKAAALLVDKRASTPAGSGSQSLAVAGSTADVSSSNANYYPASATGFLGDNASGDYDYGLGARFVLAQGIPEGSTITAASISLKSAGYVGGIPALAVKGHKTASSAVFASQADYNARTRTTASVSWTPGAWVSGTWYPSPDLAAVIQEILDNAGGLAAGVGLTLFVETATSGWGGSQTLLYHGTYDGSSASAPTLEIEWIAPAGNAGGRGVGTGAGIGLRIGAM